MSPRANAAKILLLSKVAEAKKIQAKFHRIRTHLEELRGRQEECQVTDEHLEAILKVFLVGMTTHNLYAMIWVYNFTFELREEVQSQLVREHRIIHQLERLFSFGDKLDAKFQPLLTEISQLQETVQRG